MVTSASLTNDSLVDRTARLTVSTGESAHVKLAADQLRRWRGILAEWEEFQSYLEITKQDRAVQLGISFKGDVQTEIKRIEKLPLDDETKSAVTLNSSNLPFYEALWSAAKRSTAIASIGFRNHPSDLTRRTADFVAQNGYEWVKVSTITERRMIFDLAKSGWVEGDTSNDDDDLESEGLLKLAYDLTEHAKSTRINYRNPSVRLVLPRIRVRNCHKEVLKVLNKIRQLGLTLETADDIPEATLQLSEVRDRMIPSPFGILSDTLNVDTTILLAFASDLSYNNVEANDWHDRMVAYQIKMEKLEPMLPSVLWPVCGSRKLVCTREAADRAFAIAELIGTHTERRRMALLFDSISDTCQLSREQRIEELQTLSKYQIPQDWCLPVQVIDVDLEEIQGRLPPKIVETMSKVLVGTNKSVFFYGLVSGFTTITSNRVKSRSLENTIERSRVGEEVGPNVWIAPQSRSLVGKERERRGTIPVDEGEDCEDVEAVE